MLGLIHVAGLIHVSKRGHKSTVARNKLNSRSYADDTQWHMASKLNNTEALH